MFSSWYSRCECSSLYKKRRERDYNKGTKTGKVIVPKRFSFEHDDDKMVRIPRPSRFMPLGRWSAAFWCFMEQKKVFWTQCRLFKLRVPSRIHTKSSKNAKTSKRDDETSLTRTNRKSQNPKPKQKPSLHHTRKYLCTHTSPLSPIEITLGNNKKQPNWHNNEPISYSGLVCWT